MNPAAAPFEADLDALLTPISTEQLAGESLRYDPTYDLIREARRADDANLPQGIYVTDLKKADWSLVEKLCAEALATRSKDLQLAGWLMEAWIHRYGFRGAREGLVLLRGLAEGFWDHLYPPLDEDDPELRLAPLHWIDDKLSIALKQLPITAPDVGDLPAYSFADREWADRDVALAGRDRSDGGGKDAGRVSHARFLNSVTMTPTPFFQQLHREAGGVIEAARTLEETLETQTGAPAEVLYRLRGVLQAIQDYAAQVLHEREEQPMPTAANASSSTAADAVTADAAEGLPQTLRSRADAYRMLLEAADYLAKTEPHSPTPYLVRRAVSWGGMTLVELMQELVKGQSDLAFIYELLGVRDQE